MRIGLFFGSFNPPHIGHTAIAEYMLSTMQADQIWMVVSPQNPHKKSTDLLDEQARLSLVKRALGGHEQILACDFEFDLPRPSYTVDTMIAMRAKHPDHSFFIIMGSDNIIGIASWKDYESLLSAHDIAVYPRPGYPVEASFIEALPGKVTLTEAPSIDLSSTQIRAAIDLGQTPRYLMRDAVWRKVVREGYYQPNQDV